MTPEAASLIEQARDADNPNAHDRARVRRALVSTLGAGVLTSVANSAAGTGGVVKNAAVAADGSAAHQAALTVSSSAAATAGSSATVGALPAAGTGAAGLSKLAAWAGIGFLAGATTIGGAKLLVDLAEPKREDPRVAAPERSDESVQQPAAAGVVPKIGPPPASSVVTPVLPTKNVEQPRQGRVGQLGNNGLTVTPAPRSSGTQLEAELPLIEQAQGALRDGDARRALTLLAEHERRFPNGLLVEERLAGRALALCKLGLKSEAERVARVLTRHSPASALWPSVALACGFEQ